MWRRAALAGFLAVVAVGLCGRGFGQTEEVLNGSFELGSLGWNSAAAPGAQFTTNAPANSGAQHLAITTVAGAYQEVYQTISLPANTIAATLSCYYNIQPTDLGNTQNAQMWINVADAAGNLLTNVVTKFNTDHDTVAGTYHQVTCDLTSFAAKGQLQVQFWVYGTTSGGTIFNFDDMSVLAVDTSALPANDNFANATVLTGISTNLIATNTYATKETGEPKHAGNAGGHSLWWTWTPPSPGTVTITTDGSNFDTLLAVYTGSSVSTLTKVAANDNDNGGQSLTSSVTFVATPGTQYQIAVDGYGGATGIILLSLNFKPDTSAPGIAFTSPASGAKVTSSTLTVTGTASDNIGVATVIYRLENANGTNDYQVADGTNHWSATVTNLMLGINTIRVRAFDTSSNMSPAIARSVNYVLSGGYSLTITGTGTVSPI